MRSRTGSRRTLALALALACTPCLPACTRNAANPAPAAPDAVRRELSRCTFDRVFAPEQAPEVESALRAAVRRDRYALSVRLGRCATVITESQRTAASPNPPLAQLATALDEFLPLAQHRDPNDIDLERAIRHVGNAWRRLARDAR